VAESFHQRLRAELSAMPLFAGLDERQLDSVAGTVIERRIKPGKKVIKEGQWGHQFLIVLEGELEIWRGGEVVDTVGPGGHVGELALLGDVRRNATVVARTAVVVGSIEASLFAPLLHDLPLVAERIAATVAGYDLPPADERG
jgi:CRP/FNR family cyclic AMP-dependent transcriptional regulator